MEVGVGARAGIAIAAVTRLETRGTERLAVRIGIATGLVVVGDLVGEGSAQEQAVIGETPNLAARLQALAEPGQIVFAGATRRLVGDLFRLTDLGRQIAKGNGEVGIGRAVGGVPVVESRVVAQLLFRRWARYVRRRRRPPARACRLLFDYRRGGAEFAGLSRRNAGGEPSPRASARGRLSECRSSRTARLMLFSFMARSRPPSH